MPYFIERGIRMNIPSTYHGWILAAVWAFVIFFALFLAAYTVLFWAMTWPDNAFNPMAA